MTHLDVLTAEPPPINMDEDGVFRIGGTRVRLDTVIAAFKAGASPEEILLKYPPLRLTDIYAVITYYLWHTEDVEAYLAERQRASDDVRREDEAAFSPEGIRERLLKRRAGQ